LGTDSGRHDTNSAGDHLSTYSKVLRLLTPRERKRGALVLVMAVVMALLETAGVASVAPFLSVLGNPGIVETNPILSRLYDGFGFQSTNTFLMVLGAASFSLVVLAAGFRTLTIYAMNRFIQMRGHSLSERLLETYLRQPYVFFLNRHSSDLAKGILSEVNQLVGNVLKPGLDVIAYGIVVLAMIALLVVTDPVLALVVGVGVGGLYGFIFYVVRGFLDRIGRDRVVANRERFTAAGEALGGIKDIKLLGREQAYLSRFRPSSIRFARHQATNVTVSEVPKSLIEAVAIGGVLALAIGLMATRSGLEETLPILGLYAFAGYRLLPAAQRVYAGMAQLRFGAGAVDSIYEDLRHRTSLAEISRPPAEPLPPQREIGLRDVSFNYPNAPDRALKGVNTCIPVGTSVGLAGTTGAGKTTLVDIILGLLSPTEGVLAVDGVPIGAENLRAWQSTLGYVPQDIFLSDATVAENIALGVPAGKIDRTVVEECGRMAQIHDFVITELPHGYGTEVGERGVRLSGGQRQRVGIARALYHNPSVLVFDEATSALDSVTERAVMEAVGNLSPQKTLIIIAHRLSTVRECDKIVLLEHGEVEAEDTFAELTERNERFREMAAGFL